MTFGRRLFLTGVAWSVALLMAAPILWMAMTAFKTDLDALQFPPKLLFRPTLENFASADATLSIGRPIANSIVESVGATALCFLFALPAAFALAFGPDRGRRAILLGMLTTRFMPAIGMVIPVYLIFKAVGLIDTRLGLVLVDALTDLPIAIWMLYATMREVPRDILDGARIDGATAGQQLLLILLPLCAPGVCSTALLCAVLCWNEAFWSIQLTSSAGAPLSAYVATLSGDLLWAKLSAASLLAVGPILLIGWLTQRQFVRGLTFGAMR